MKRIAKRLALFALIVFVLIQLVPYGREHSNPPVLGEPKWDTPRTRELAARACFDCHSNATRWPWYSHLAPMSWLVQRDVDEGRAHMNFSEWTLPQKHAHEAVEMLTSGEMPPWFYLPLHGEARLTDEEQTELEHGLAYVVGVRADADRGDQR